MPIYKYEHDCGIETQQIYMEQDVDSKIVECFNCGIKVTARQIRDKSLSVGEADGVKGILQNGKTEKHLGNSGR